MIRHMRIVIPGNRADHLAIHLDRISRQQDAAGGEFRKCNVPDAIHGGAGCGSGFVGADEFHDTPGRKGP